MSDVLAFAGVTVVRGDKKLLDDVTWEVEEGERWVVLGPNGAGKTTLLQIAAARMHPSSGVAGVLSEVLGAVNVFELRPRIGLASAAIADRVPREERVGDVVVTASYGMVGRWREQYDELDHERAKELLATIGADHLIDRRFGTLSEGSASASRSRAPSWLTRNSCCSTSPPRVSTWVAARTSSAVWVSWPRTSMRPQWSW